MKTRIGGWTIETYETNGCFLGQKITSPAGRTATAYYIGGDERLSKLRTRANIEFSSATLRLSEALVDRMIRAAREYVAAELEREPEFTLTGV